MGSVFQPTGQVQCGWDGCKSCGRLLVGRPMNTQNRVEDYYEKEAREKRRGRRDRNRKKKNPECIGGHEDLTKLSSSVFQKSVPQLPPRLKLRPGIDVKCMTR